MPNADGTSQCACGGEFWTGLRQFRIGALEEASLIGRDTR